MFHTYSLAQFSQQSYEGDNEIMATNDDIVQIPLGQAFKNMRNRHFKKICFSDKVKPRLIK